MGGLKKALALLLSGWLLALPVCADTPTRLIALCYHDVRDDVFVDLDEDEFAVSTAHLLQHFRWLKENGYQPVSLDDIDAARRGLRRLPAKPVLLSFDDGYRSFYDKIYPLLQLYDYPAVFALVVKWLEVDAEGVVPYGKIRRPRSDFLSWSQIREMQASGLVEFASHSYDSHRGVIANPQGNEQAALVTRRYHAGAGYESEQAYRRRVAEDLRRSVEIMAAETGRRPRAMVWPYGRYNLALVEQALQLGMAYQLTLDEAPATSAASFKIDRLLITRNPDVEQFKNLLEPAPQPAPQRVVHVDLDYVYDPDPGQLSRNLDQLLDRIKALKVSTVYLQAFADPDGDGNAAALYFPNRHLPVRANLFSRVAWQLYTRAEVEVYAWMPISAFVPSRPLPANRWVWEWRGGKALPSSHNYRRLSIFHPDNRRLIKEIYADLGRYSSFNGLLFHDDGLLTDFEDVSPAAMAHYRRAGLAVDDPAQLRQPPLRARWTRLKSRALIDFTQELVAQVRHYRPRLKSARNIYARPLLQPHSEEWFAQRLEDFLAAYDYTAVMAMPYMEGAEQSLPWLRQLLDSVPPQHYPRMVFELQAVDWRSSTPLSGNELAAQMRLLQRRGALNFGYYPDNFLSNQPAFAAIKGAMSLEEYPYERR